MQTGRDHGQCRHRDPADDDHERDREDERRSALALASRKTTRHGDRTTRVSERGWLFGMVTVSSMGGHGVVVAAGGQGALVIGFTE